MGTIKQGEDIVLSSRLAIFGAKELHQLRLEFRSESAQSLCRVQRAEKPSL